MKAPTKAGWTLTPEQRSELRRLSRAAYRAFLGSPEAIDATDPDVLALLEAWERCKVPSSVRPLVCAYRSKGGNWIIGPIPALLSAIGRHLEEA